MTERKARARSELTASQRMAVGQHVSERRGPMVGLLARKLGSIEAAEDALQQGCVNALSSSPQDGVITPGWIYTAAKNAGIDEWRKNSRRPSISLELTGADRSSDHFNPEAYAIRAERVRVLQQHLNILSAEDRAIVIYAVVEGMGSREIGATIGMHEGTVRTRLRRALLKLRKIAENDPRLKDDEAA